MKCTTSPSPLLLLLLLEESGQTDKSATLPPSRLCILLGRRGWWSRFFFRETIKTSRKMAKSRQIRDEQKESRAEKGRDGKDHFWSSTDEHRISTRKIKTRKHQVSVSSLVMHYHPCIACKCSQYVPNNHTRTQCLRVSIKWMHFCLHLFAFEKKVFRISPGFLAVM